MGFAVVMITLSMSYYRLLQSFCCICLLSHTGLLCGHSRSCTGLGKKLLYESLVPGRLNIESYLTEIYSHSSLPSPPSHVEGRGRAKNRSGVLPNETRELLQCMG